MITQPRCFGHVVAQDIMARECGREGLFTSWQQEESQHHLQGYIPSHLTSPKCYRLGPLGDIPDPNSSEPHAL